MATSQESLASAMPSWVGKGVPGRRIPGVRAYRPSSPAPNPSSPQTGQSCRDDRDDQRGPDQHLGRGQRLGEGDRLDGVQERIGPAGETVQVLRRLLVGIPLAQARVQDERAGGQPQRQLPGEVVPVHDGSFSSEVSVRRGRRPASCATPAPGRPRAGGRAPRRPRSTSSVGTARTSNRWQSAGRPVDVDLDQLDHAGPLGGQLFQGGADHAARTAPGRPEIHEHRDRSPLGDLGEVVVARVGDPGQGLRGSCRTSAPSRRPPPAPGSACRSAGRRRRARPRGRVGALMPALRPGSWETTSWSPPTSTRTVDPPSGTASRSSARATWVSTSRAMNRRSGRAPYTGS